MTVLTEEQMNEIMDNGTIDQCSKFEKEQVFKFAFGEEFMDSDDKGAKKTYEK